MKHTINEAKGLEPSWFKSFCCFSVYDILNTDYVITEVFIMDHEEKKGLAFYIALGMAMDALAGIIIAVFAALVLHSVFLAVSGTGFGMCAGVLVGDIIYCIKNRAK